MKTPYFSFNLKNHNTSIRQEIIAGLTTFFSMAYIALLLPNLLTQIGMPAGPLFLTTCLVAIVGCTLMGFMANLPIAIAPAVGTLAYFQVVIVGSNHITWQAGVLALQLSAIMLVIITAFKWQKKIVEALPHVFFAAICAGLGLFLIFIALKQSGTFTYDHSILELHPTSWKPESYIFILSLSATIILDKLRIPGAFIIAILLATLTSIFLGYSHYHGFFSLPTGLHNTLFSADISAISQPVIWQSAACLTLITLFDNTGTLVGLTTSIPNRKKDPTHKPIVRGVLANACSTFFASLISTPSTSTFLESASGIQAGGKTGLTSLVIAACFIMLLFFSPLVHAIPSQATAAILLYIGYLMLLKITKLPLSNQPLFIGGLTTIITIPLTFSIADGLAYGLIAYSIISLCTKNFRLQFHAKTLWVTGLLITYFITYHFGSIVRIFNTN